MSGVLLRGNVTCTYTASRLTRANAFAIHGTDGYVRLADDRIVLRGHTEFRGQVFDYAEPGRELTLSRSKLEPQLRHESAAVELHGRFARAIDDRDDFPCSGEQGVADLVLIDAIARAMATGNTTTIV